MNIVTDDGFRFMTVLASQRIGPHMQRLRLGGRNLACFDTLTNLHVRLYVPTSASSALAKPVLGADGRPRLQGQEGEWAMRYYTIRDINAAAGWLDVDFVLHEAAGPACDFARRARPGDMCGISGPCGLGVKAARHYLLAGDETAVPAIARIAASLPQEARGKILIEAAEAEDATAFPAPPGISVLWFTRGDGGDFSVSVSQAVSDMADMGNDGFTWIAGEFSVCEAVRPSLRNIAKKRYMNVPYWRASTPREAQR